VSPECTDLEALHARHHERLEEHLLCTVEALMAVDVDAARDRFAVFIAELREGLELEERTILPAYRALGSHAPQGRPNVVDGDHVILERGIEATLAWLTALAALPSSADVRRRDVAIGLPVVHRLLATLEHHGERERRHVYPAVAGVLQDDDRAAAVAILSGLVTDTPS
jgi:hypothetical protein